jgi:hypothetical protein
LAEIDVHQLLAHAELEVNRLEEARSTQDSAERLPILLMQGVVRPFAIVQSR